MFGQVITGRIMCLTALMWMPALAMAQSNGPGEVPGEARVAMPRLSLPVARENYPADAFIAHEEGSVVLIATIGVDGQMSNARIETSSGYASLDEASIALANAARLPTPPTNAAGDAISVDVMVDVVWQMPIQNGSNSSGADKLQPDSSSAFALAYFTPDADFAGYDGFILEGPEVAFREGWRRQHLQARFSDMERIKNECAEWFRAEFIASFQGEGGYRLVDLPGEGILTIRAGIGDLDIAAPFLASDIDPGFTLAQGGTSATMIVELVDSSTGQILARVFDPGQEASTNFDTPVTRYSNERDARVLFGGWAEKLRARLDADR